MSTRRRKTPLLLPDALNMINVRIYIEIESVRKIAASNKKGCELGVLSMTADLFALAAKHIEMIINLVGKDFTEKQSDDLMKKIITERDRILDRAARDFYKFRLVKGDI